VSVAERIPVTAAEIAGTVSEREFRRLLLLPRMGDLPDAVLGTMRAARRWYSVHGEPFVASRRAELEDVDRSSVILASGAELAGDALARYLAEAEAGAVVVVAASAGASVALEAARLWADDRPDEAYALDRFAAAVAERLLLHVFAQLCGTFSRQGEQVMRHLSPGCGGWEIVHQHDLMTLLGGRLSAADGDGRAATLGPVTLLASGGLSPQHSVLAIFGVTRVARAGTAVIACRACDLDPCSFRRVPPARESVRSQVNS
jgi:hypothetical protein